MQFQQVYEAKTYLAASVDVSAGVANGDGAHDFSVAQRVDLARVSRDAGADERVLRERNRLHVAVGADVE